MEFLLQQLPDLRVQRPERLVHEHNLRIERKQSGERSRYRLRKQVVEPVFGQVKEARGFRQFLLRGIEKVKAEWAMICTVHNHQKLALGRRMSTFMISLRTATTKQTGS